MGSDSVGVVHEVRRSVGLSLQHRAYVIAQSRIGVVELTLRPGDPRHFLALRVELWPPPNNQQT
jgi:hypothetical protein